MTSVEHDARLHRAAEWTSLCRACRAELVPVDPNARPVLANMKPLDCWCGWLNPGEGITLWELIFYNPRCPLHREETT